MLVKVLFLLLPLSLSFFSGDTMASEKNHYVCGLANGYPPYQFKNNKNQTTGFDADVLRLVFKKMNKHLMFRQMDWNDVLGLLKYSYELDCVGGMEINEYRKRHFEFTSPYYHRKIAVFVREDNHSMRKIEDLAGKRITGDRHSYVEKLLIKKGLQKQIRIQQTKSKEEAMMMLKEGTSVAMIAPKAVGLYLAKQMKVAVRCLDIYDPGSPVGIAVKKGNSDLLVLLEAALQELMKEGVVENLYNEWFDFWHPVNGMKNNKLKGTDHGSNESPCKIKG